MAKNKDRLAVPQFEINESSGLSHACATINSCIRLITHLIALRKAN